MSDAMSEVRAAIQEALDGGAVDPTDVADKADTSLSDEVRLEAWSVLLRNYARIVIGSNRASVSPDMIPAPRAPEPARTPEAVAVGGNRFASPRQARQFSWWQKRCAVPECAAGAWKQLGDFTLEEVLLLAQDRRNQADELAAVAARFDRYAAEMKRQGVETLRQLDEETARKVWEEAA